MKKNTNDNEILKDENGNQVVINGEKEDSKEDLVDKKTLKKYRVHWYQRIPYPVRAEFIKYWFFGLNYFLFDMGIGSLEFFRGSTTDMLAYSTLILFLISGFALGVFNDIFLYNILDVIEDYPKQKQPFVIFKSKKIYSLFINIVYGIVVVFLSRWLSGLIALAIDPQLTSSWGWFREPFTCALVMFVVDGAFIGVKNLIVLLVRRIKGVNSAEL
jgi:hypothetical protein